MEFHCSGGLWQGHPAHKHYYEVSFMHLAFHTRDRTTHRQLMQTPGLPPRTPGAPQSSTASTSEKQNMVAENATAYSRKESAAEEGSRDCSTGEAFLLGLKPDGQDAMYICEGGESTAQIYPCRICAHTHRCHTAAVECTRQHLDQRAEGWNSSIQNEDCTSSGEHVMSEEILTVLRQNLLELLKVGI